MRRGVGLRAVSLVRVGWVGEMGACVLLRCDFGVSFFFFFAICNVVVGDIGCVAGEGMICVRMGNR